MTTKESRQEFEEYWEKEGVTIEPPVLRLAFKEIAQKAWQVASNELTAVTEQQVNNNRVIELLKDGLQTDGSHHKQWYLNEVLKLINADIAKDVEMHWTHDKGIAP